jgi:membrane protease YdiL (CAAX protease family)
MLKKEKINFSIVSFFYLSISIINGYFFNYIHTFYNVNNNQENINSLPHFDKFFILIIFAPILETTFFQYIPIEFSLKYTQKEWIAILISSLCFCSIHIYSFIYVLMAFFGGVILAKYYLYVRNKNKMPILFTIFFHALYNIYGLLFVN